MTGRQLRWETIADTLRRGIADGTYPAGSLLPSIKQLMAHHAASDGPVRQALAQLASEGLAVAEPGRGVRVTGVAPGTPVTPDVAARLAALEARLDGHLGDGHAHP